MQGRAGVAGDSEVITHAGTGAQESAARALRVRFCQVNTIDIAGTAFPESFQPFTSFLSASLTPLRPDATMRNIGTAAYTAIRNH